MNEKQSDEITCRYLHDLEDLTAWTFELYQIDTDKPDYVTFDIEIPITKPVKETK